MQVTSAIICTIRTRYFN